MKKRLIPLLSLLVALSLCASAEPVPEAPEAESEIIEASTAFDEWIYFGDEEIVAAPSAETSEETDIVSPKGINSVKPTGVAIAQGKTAVVNLGETLKLTATLRPSNAQSEITWKSSKLKVARVSADGVVTPLKEGKAKITATTLNKKKAAITITVVDPYKPTGVRIAQGSRVVVNVGETVALDAVLTPAAANTTLTWRSSKSKVARVNASGSVTGYKKGTAKITVTTANRKRARVTVVVVDPYEPQGVAISPSNALIVRVGATVQLGATLTPLTARSKLKWSSGNKRVAKVSSAGLLTAVRKGRATITVKTENGKKAKLRVTVVE